jgi:BirA family biotin operon repressor/biotin-[acetyl-CoA-carboxylase] ligase
MIDADKAQHGMTIVTEKQTAGKGQRGNPWVDDTAQSLLMSIILQPKQPIEAQFAFSASVAVALVDVLQSLDKKIDVSIKFPNDIIISDKKAAGILIENSIRGTVWTHAIVGVGLNVLQHHFDDNLPNAISLLLATQKPWVIEGLLLSIRQRIIEYTSVQDLSPMLEKYNQLLYKRGRKQLFAEGENKFEALISGVNEKGKLLLQHSDNQLVAYPHGQLTWIWE